MLTTGAEGVFLIMPTPFADTGELDLESTDRLVDAYCDAGAAGLVVLGIMGEAPKLTTQESLSFVQRVLDRAGARVPVVAGVSSAGFAAMSTLSARVMDAGAAGVMVAPSPTLRSDAQITGYYDDVVEAIGSDVPFVVQDFPQATGVIMPVPVILEIAARHPSCVMLKHEDWPGLDKISAIREAQNRDHRRISILCGNGGLFLPYEMERGADGAMTGYAYPEMLVAVVERCRAGDRQGAHDLFDLHLPLIRYETQPGLGLAVRKYVLKQRGLIASDKVRKPAPRLTPQTMAEIEWMMSRIAATS